MKKTTITLVIALMSIALAGLIILQMYWIKKAETLNKQQFHSSVHRAMKNVSERLERRQVRDYVQKEIAISTQTAGKDTAGLFFRGLLLES